ncbi:hypothetical protein [Brevifollis gellanilyticus]|uniref:DUF1795 domain-containing protein n=1 Tax=Brevifollis gellanilyticus TaxID=748831 RepID=A0A512MBC2_9BACT|nr:hypothetical protein [Brevifollis gellanilyticus]GEP44032.1 hypothetical protein BGE01nite_33230 [Brevifollis gellanilyticus]
MKLIPLIIALIAFASTSSAFAQRANATPTMLKGPADWRFERLPIPPGFARDIPWTGYEEARFAPGMFDTSSANHFTYALSIYVDGTAPVQAPALKSFLDKYLKGLSVMVGRRKGLKPDEAQFNAEVLPRKTEANATGTFTAKATMFDTFNDGGKVSLNMEIDVLPKAEAQKTQIILLITPQAFDAPVWKQLREIRSSVQAPQ